MKIQSRQPMRWRIASAYLLLFLTVLALLTLAGLAQLRTSYIQTLEMGVAGQARLLAIVVAPTLLHPGDPTVLTKMVDNAQAQLDARVSVIAADGTMLADSLQAPGDNVLSRPEVRTALSQGQGANERQSTATGDDRLYVAVPIEGSSGPMGVVRIGVALRTITEAQTRLAVTVLVTALITTAVTVALAMLIARRTTQPLLDLRAMAGRLAAGDLLVQVPVPQDEEIAALAQDFNQMAGRLRHVEQSRRTLLSDIAHDLRTPLTSLQAMVETLQDGALEERTVALDFLRRMQDEVQGMTRLVNEVLELAGIESGDIALDLMPTDIGLLLRSAAKRMQAQAQKSQLSIDLVVPASLPTIMIDTVRIEQAILNVVQNAIGFTPPEGTITLGAQSDERTITLWVRDTGIGIAPDELPHIFERAYKVDRSRTRRGTGLGLAIVKHVIERHGGSVSAESLVDHGTTIFITLPLQQPFDAREGN